MVGVSETESGTRDKTPREFSALRGPFAQQIAQWFGGSVQEDGGPKRRPFFEFVPGAGGGIFSGVGTGFMGVSNPSLFAAQLSPEERAQTAAIAGESGGTAETQAAADLRRRIIAGEFLEPDERTRASRQRPVLEAFEEARRADTGAFTRAGQRVQESSPFFRARALAQRGLADALADMDVELREGERNRQFAAAAGAESIDAQRAATQIQRLQASALPRLVQDLGIQRGIEEFNRRAAELLHILGLAAGTTAPALAANSSGKSVSVL